MHTFTHILFLPPSPPLHMFMTQCTGFPPTKSALWLTLNLQLVLDLFDDLENERFCKLKVD